jgi:phage terminase small subunit
MRGRKPKPTALKILEGAQPCRINTREPRMPAGGLDPPKWLDEFGQEHWRELAPILQAAGLLTVGDRPALAQLCDEYSTIRKDVDADNARERYRRLLVEFGLTPSSRSRLKSDAEPRRDALSEFLHRKNG